MRAMSIFSREAGTSTRGCRARAALRIRVSMSAIGSVSIAAFLPARLDHAGNLAGQRPQPEADAAELELPQIAPRTPAEPAAVTHPHAEFRLLPHLGKLTGSRHRSSLAPQRQPEQPQQLAALLVGCRRRRQANVHPA